MATDTEKGAFPGGFVSEILAMSDEDDITEKGFGKSLALLKLLRTSQDAENELRGVWREMIEKRLDEIEIHHLTRTNGR